MRCALQRWAENLGDALGFFVGVRLSLSYFALHGADLRGCTQLFFDALCCPALPTLNSAALHCAAACCAAPSCAALRCTVPRIFALCFALVHCYDVLQHATPGFGMLRHVLATLPHFARITIFCALLCHVAR